MIGGEGEAMETLGELGAAAVGEPEAAAEQAEALVAGEAKEQAPAEAAGQPEAPEGVDVAKLRELVLRAYPEAIPELVQGATLEELEASARLATEVYRRVAGQVREAAAREAASSVPAGQPGRQRYLMDVEALSPSAKIAEGLRRRERET